MSKFKAGQRVTTFATKENRIQQVLGVIVPTEHDLYISVYLDEGYTVYRHDTEIVDASLVYDQPQPEAQPSPVASGDAGDIGIIGLKLEKAHAVLSDAYDRAFEAKELYVALRINSAINEIENALATVNKKERSLLVTSSSGELEPPF
jgi:hypothetical protein